MTLTLLATSSTRILMKATMKTAAFRAMERAAEDGRLTPAMHEQLLDQVAARVLVAERAITRALNEYYPAPPLDEREQAIADRILGTSA